MRSMVVKATAFLNIYHRGKCLMLGRAEEYRFIKMQNSIVKNCVDICN